MTRQNLGPGSRKCKEIPNAVLREALSNAIVLAGISKATAARLCGVDATTLDRWLAEGKRRDRTRIDVGAVMSSARLCPHFVDHLYRWRLGEFADRVVAISND